MNKIDYKKKFKHLYQPKTQPELVEVPPIQFFAVSGQGAPAGEEYTKALEVLYGLSFTVKMSKMGNNHLEGYFDYVVPPLESLWYSLDKQHLDIASPKDTWNWTSLIRQPEFVNKEVFYWAIAQLKEKKPSIDSSNVTFITLNEGLCVQMMHIGPYSEEPATIAKIQAFMKENNLKHTTDGRHHHEIYLSDPRKTKPEKLKTVLRLPVEKIIQ